MSRVLLLQPHPEVGERMRALIEAAAGFEVVGCVGSAADLRPSVLALDPDLVLADLETLGTSVATTLRQLREGRYDRPKVLVIAMSAEDPRLLEALRDGVDGWFAPGASRSLPGCMTQVLQGESMLTRAMARAIQDHFASRAWDDTDFIAESQDPLRLSGTERILLQALADGRAVPDIARALQISAHAVGVRMRTIVRKLQFDLAADALALTIGPAARSMQLR